MPLKRTPSAHEDALSRRTTVWIASPLVATYRFPSASIPMPSADFGVVIVCGAPPPFGKRRTCEPTFVDPNTSPSGPTATSATNSSEENASWVLNAPFAEKTWIR